MSRIAIMLPKYSRYGGVEQFGYRLAGALAKRGHAVDFICARQEAEPPEGVTVKAVGRPPGSRALKLLWFLVQAERLRKKGGYDLSISLGKTWNQDVSRMGGGPLRTFWEKSERALPEGRERLVKRLKRRASPYNWLTLLVEKHQFTKDSEVISVSHLVRDWLMQAHPDLAAERMRVVYNRPDPARYPWPTKEERAAAKLALLQRLPKAFPPLLGEGAEEESVEGAAAKPRVQTIGTASTNFELKGVGPLIRALALLPENTVLFIAGGRDHAAYDALAKELGVAERVAFLGKVDDMPAFYRGLDVFILPTFYDACSNAVLEALASGCKTVTSASNGAAFFLEQNAVLENPGDVAAMTAMLQDKLEVPAPKRFDWPDDVPSGLDAFVELVEEAVEKKRGRA
ncbi:glycosyltransferase family 4 protein [Desulfovibrio sp. OttesenSCG-928-G15]|nr:glycosyltransferase family 4 protein [Desulfovibrio sp. OttesenSCG-928-G15]